jgi:hypothetical protein
VFLLHTVKRATCYLTPISPAGSSEFDVKEGLHWGLAKAPAALGWPPLIALAESSAQVGLQLLDDRADDLLLLRGPIRNFVRAGRVKQSGHGHCEALAEQDGELGLGHGPLARRHHPLLFGAVQHQEKKFCGGVITWEMTPGSDGPAEFGIQSLDGIRNRYEDRGAHSFGWGLRVSGVWCDHPGRGEPGSTLSGQADVHHEPRARVR